MSEETKLAPAAGAPIEAPLKSGMSSAAVVQDTVAPPPTNPDGSPDDVAQNNLVLRDRHGDPLPDPKAVDMRERESYERVIDGLKIAAEAAKHVARQEPQRFAMWMGVSVRLDQVRKIAVQTAGIEDVVRVHETGEVRGDGLDWSVARNRFRYGLKQASGGCRQLAVCHRGEIGWSRIASELEKMHAGVSRPPMLTPQPRPGLIVPMNGSVH